MRKESWSVKKRSQFALYALASGYQAQAEMFVWFYVAGQWIVGIVATCDAIRLTITCEEDVYTRSYADVFLCSGQDDLPVGVK